MLVSDFVEESLSLGDAQFAISLALSQLGEHKAARAVLTYLGTKDATEEVLQRRAEIRDAIVSSNQGTVLGLLNILCNNKELSVVNNVRATKVQSRKTLTELLERQSVGNVYNQTMYILSSNSTSKLLLLYMDTQEYRKAFFGDVRNRFYKSADGFRNNNLSDSVCEEIRRAFRRWIDFYSSNGTYDPASGAPMAYLRYAFSVMYAASADSDVYKILNTTGTNADAGEDATLIDFVGLENDYKDTDFDFIEVASRINRASRLLFSHNNNPIAFYDIFSCYRDGVLSRKFEDKERSFKKALVGCAIRIVDSSQECGRGHEGAIKNKKTGRIALCRVFESIIEKGIAQDEILKLYDKVITLTDTLSRKDGVRLFSTPNQTTKHRESNSEMLQIIVSGYLGVRELLDFLENNDLGASVYNFPSIIFRNAEYLKRFQTVEEYVRYVSPVSMLVEQAATDTTKMQDDIDGVVRNEIVWGYLGASNLLHDGIFKKLATMPLEYIKSAVDDSRVISKEDYFIQHLWTITQDMQRLYEWISEKLNDNTFVGNFNLSRQLSMQIVSDKFADSGKDSQYATSILFVLITKKLFAAEGAPILDDDGNYLLKEEDCLKELTRILNLVCSPETAENTRKLYVQTMGLRCKAFNIIYELYTGIKTDNCTWAQLREVFFFTDVLYSIISKYNTRLGELSAQNNKSSIYLLLANIATDTTLFNLTLPLSSCDELSFVFEKELPQYFINQTVGTEESLVYNTQRNSNLLTAVNRFFEERKEDVNSLHLAFDMLEKFVSKKHSPMTKESPVEKLLIKASESVRTLEAYNKVDAGLRSKLEGMFKADEYGYIICDGERFVLDNKYMLVSGYAIELDLYNWSFKRSIITLNDINVLQNRLIFRSY